MWENKLLISILLYCYYLYLQSKGKNNYVITIPRRSLYIVSALIFFQIIYGTFTAGLNAGYAYNTFPYMDEDIFPYKLFLGNTLFHNLFVKYLVSMPVIPGVL